MPHTLKPITQIKSPLYVVTVIANPQRYLSRYKLYREFEKRTLDAGAKLITVEATFGERSSEVFGNPNVTYVPVQTTAELWHKESMINIGIRHLPDDWKYVAWIDADVMFARPDWVQETLHQLQHYQLVQLFSYAKDLCPKHTPLTEHRSFVWCYLNDMPTGKSYQSWHPGFAWAARREAINSLSGLIDYAIAGSADRHMACALINRLQDSFPPELKITCSRYYENLLIWQDRAERYIKRNIGYVDGLLLHYWHGNKLNRQYQNRWKILTDTRYNPDTDIKSDWQGLWQLTDRTIVLRDRLRQYFRNRNEDSIDIITATTQSKDSRRN